MRIGYFLKLALVFFISLSLAIGGGKCSEQKLS